jgi:hypothetical protein
MTIALSSPVTGGAQTGFTSPTYTLTADTPPAGSGGKQYAVTALGGTQAGVTSHSIARPFTVGWLPPRVLKTLPAANIAGVVTPIERNVHTLLVRAGVSPLTGQANQVALARVRFEIPCGADTQDPAQLRAMVSLLVGALSQLSAGAGDTLINGVL